MKNEKEDECLMDLSVNVEDGWLSYNKKNSTSDFVLKNLCMKVPNNNIYALLGASGCGKTTLISCILGLRQLDAGRITIWGRKQSDHACGVLSKNVGYMPQDLSLYMEFTTKETIRFFGGIHNMSRAEIEERYKFFVEFLQLPTKKRFIKNLSGGQQRRVSFAMALLHNPKLLILDEPTVGVDPVLRRRIWDYLVDLAHNGKTIIISTHYIEEARQAHKVALMYDGRFLLEDSPENVMSHCETDTLEGAFLKVCRTRGKEDNRNLTLPALENELIVGSSQKQSIEFSWSMFKSIVWKEFLRFTRNRMLLTFCLILPPLVVATTAVASATKPHHVGFGVVNDELPLDPLCSSQLPVDKCDFTYLSCRVIRHIDSHMLEMSAFKDENQIVESVKQGDIWGGFIFSSNYSRNFQKRIEEGTKASNETVSASEVRIQMDMTSQHINYFFVTMLMNSMNAFVKDVLESCSIDPSVVSLPIKYDKPVYGDMHEVTLADCGVTGIIVTCMFFLTSNYASMSLIKEKNTGVLDRLRISGTRPFLLMLGYVVMQFAVAGFQITGMMFTQVYMFNIPLESSVVWPVILLFMQATIGVLFGFVIGMFMSDEILAMQIEVMIVLLFMVTNGTLWPIEALPQLLRNLSFLTPTTCALDAYRIMSLNGFDITRHSIWLGYTASGAWILGLFAFLYIAVKFNKA